MTKLDELTVADVSDKLTQFTLDSNGSEQQHRLTLIAYQLSNLKLLETIFVFPKPVKCRLFWLQSCAHNERERA
jgi:hypothetical protein